MNHIGTKGLAEALGISKDAADRLVSRPDFPPPDATESTGQRGGRPEKRWRIPDLPETLKIRRRDVAIRAPAQAWALHQAIAAPRAVPPAPTFEPSTGAAELPAPLPVTERPERQAGFFIPKTDAQLATEGARAGVIAAIRRCQAESGCSQEAAMQTLLTLAAAGKADPIVVRSLQLARDGRGRKGNGLPSTRTLKRWLGATDLAPRQPQRDMTVPAWAKTFLLDHYQTPQKPSIESAYREFCNAWEGETPSVHQVRYLVAKLGTITRERGRMGPRELKNIRPYVTRSFDQLEPNDIWSADGHTFDAEVQHPFHGRPFRPEITSIVDIATRRIVGWSVSLAESGTAVLDALRHAAESAGLAAVFYVDRGSGYDNDLLKAEGTGLAGRLGFEVKHSIAYNSQARGVIERLHKTVWVEGAKLLPSYIGAAMDREAKLAQFKLTRQVLKRGGAMPLLPWDVFIDFARSRVAAYNARGHRSLKGVSPDLRWREFELQGWEAHRLAAVDLDTLFRPRVMRTLSRGRINLFTNYYSNNALEEFHGDRVMVAYDLLNVDKVWIYTPEGRYIGEALVNGNTRHYYPVPVVQQAREKRVEAAEKRVKVKLAAIREELRGPALEAPEWQPIPTVMPQPEPVRVPSRSERPIAEIVDEWVALDDRIAAGETVTEDDAYWHGSVQKSPAWRAEMKRRESDDLDAEGRRAAG